MAVKYTGQELEIGEYLQGCVDPGYLECGKGQFTNTMT